MTSLFTFSPTPKKKTTRKNISGILSSARDWRIRCDLHELHLKDQYMLPHVAIVSPLKVYICIISIKAKVILFIELTCRNDENIQIRCQKKKDKYAHFS